MATRALAFCAGPALPSRALLRTHASRRTVPRCGSLEESRKRARSAYDNIPDLNEMYLRELRRLQRQGATPVEAAEAPPVLPLRESAPAARRRVRARAARAPPADEAAELAASRAQSLEAYARLRARLVGDTAFIGALACAAAWAVGDLKAAASVAVGSAAGAAYVTLLARGVDRMGTAGDLLAPARAAILALAVVATARHRDVLDVLPVMLGFFMYKVATVLPLVTGEAFEES